MTIKPNTESTIETLEIVQVTKNSTSPKPLGVLVRMLNSLFHIPYQHLTEVTELKLERYPVYFYDLPQEQQVLPTSQHYLADLSNYIPTVSKNHILVFLVESLISKGVYSTEIDIKHMGYQIEHQKETNNLT